MLQTYRRDWARFDKNEKNSHYKAFIEVLKKYSILFTICQTWPLFSRPLPGPKKLLGKLKDFVKNSRLCTNPEVWPWQTRQSAVTVPPPKLSSNAQLKSLPSRTNYTSCSIIRRGIVSTANTVKPRWTVICPDFISLPCTIFAGWTTGTITDIFTMCLVIESP